MQHTTNKTYWNLNISTTRTGNTRSMFNQTCILLREGFKACSGLKHDVLNEGGFLPRSF